MTPKVDAVLFSIVFQKIYFSCDVYSIYGILNNINLLFFSFLLE